MFVGNRGLVVEKREEEAIVVGDEGYGGESGGLGGEERRLVEETS